MIIGENIENKLISKYRDKMYIERNNILNNYAEQTLNKGQMYYIYDQNSAIKNVYNACLCEKGKSHIVIQINKEELSDNIGIGSVLRKVGKNYRLDTDSSNEISQKISKMQENILQEQVQYLSSKRIEEHIYELSEKASDRVWLFDITENSNEALEEINFPENLLNNAKEGDKFVYKNGEYKVIN